MRKYAALCAMVAFVFVVAVLRSAAEGDRGWFYE